MNLRRNSLLLFLTILAGCERTAPAAPVSNALYVPPEAREVDRVSQPGGASVVRYTIETPYPAKEFVNRLSAHFEKTGWKPLEHDWLNPTIPSSHRRGWTYFVDARKKEQEGIHQWMAQWTNEKGDIAAYGLQYASPIESEERARPSTARMEVSGSLIPAATARQVVRQVGRMPTPSVVFHPAVKPPDSLRPPGSDEVQLQEVTDDGRTQVFTITRERAESLPDWEPDTQPPPLALMKAIDVAKAAARKRQPKFDDLKVTSVNLNGINCYPVIPGKWYYVVHMSPVMDGRAFFGGIWEVVLMDGTVVEPREKKRG